MPTTFQLVLMEDARAFLQGLTAQARQKVMYNIGRVAGGERNSELFKKLEGSEIWEFRTLHGRVAYRLFAFWDTERGAFVVATHGMVKKTQKTPRKEIAKAESIMEHYFKSKHGDGTSG